jgi:hypothetical protein
MARMRQVIYLQIIRIVLPGIFQVTAEEIIKFSSYENSYRYYCWFDNLWIDCYIG